MLAARTLGEGSRTVVLLHGLVASGVFWGDAYDALAHGGRLVVPDLLGFGGSVAAPTGSYDLAAHLKSLDGVVGRTTDDDGSMVVIGHSMGAVLAACWAARRRDVTAVVLVCPPLYVDREEARRHLRAMGLMERLFVVEGPVSEWLCGVMCRHRRLAGTLAVTLEPRLPVAVARQGVRHTWPSYLGGLTSVVIGAPWAAALDELERRQVPVMLIEGARDPVSVAGRAESLRLRHDNLTVRTHPTADHLLPMQYLEWCLRAMRSVL